MGKGQDAAGIIIIDEHDKVLLVHQTYGKKQWSVPGGMVEEGEAAWEAAKRELREEVNISVKDTEVSGIYYQPHKDRYIFNFKATAYEGKLEVDHNEIDQCGFFSLDELPRPISSFTVERLRDAINSRTTVYRTELKETYEMIYD